MELTQQIASIAVVFALLIASLALVRGKGLLRSRLPNWRASGQRPIELIDRLALTPQHGLYVVRSGGQILLFATHPQGVDLIEPPAADGSTFSRAASAGVDR